MFATFGNYAHEMNQQQSLIHYVTEPKNWQGKHKQILRLITLAFITL